LLIKHEPKEEDRQIKRTDTTTRMMLEAPTLQDTQQFPSPPESRALTQDFLDHKTNKSTQATDNFVSQPQVKEEFKSQSLRRMTTKEEEELSMQLILKIQQEEEELVKKQKERVVDDATCQICLDDLYSQKFKPLEKCPHVYHEDCIKEYIKMKIDEKGFPITCPAPDCKSEVTLADAEILGQEYVDKFISFSLKSYIEKHVDEVSCCPTPDCPFAFLAEEGQNEFKCPACNKHYCLNCRVEWHKGMTCKEYEITHKRDENDEKFEKLMKGKKYKQCPKCKFWVSKSEGCDAMTCRCGTMFCYHCGRPGDGHYCTCRQKINMPIVQQNLFNR